MKFNALIIILILLTGCSQSGSEPKKTIETYGFTIEVPANWHYKKELGTDSFVGKIVGRSVELEFDWSRMGYANSLAPTIDEYLNSTDWMPMLPPNLKPDVTYTSGDVNALRNKIMKEKGITDTTLVKVEKYPRPEKKITFDKGKYIATLTYADTIQIVNIEIPDVVKNHVIQFDTIGNYSRKIVRPAPGQQGMTGVYFKDLNSGFNFNLVDYDLSLENQEKAIAAFKTIKIKMN